MITCRGIATAVVIPIHEWNRLQAARPERTMLGILQSGPRFEIPLPDRGKLRMRKAKAL